MIHELVTLDVAIAPYRGVTLRQIRGWISAGRLAASKLGRCYFVSPSDVASLLAPKLQAPKPRRPRESETRRIKRQLAAAGVA